MLGKYDRVLAGKWLEGADSFDIRFVRVKRFRQFALHVQNLFRARATFRLVVIGGAEREMQHLTRRNGQHVAC